MKKSLQSRKRYFFFSKRKTIPKSKPKNFTTISKAMAGSWGENPK
jgi:hypothetical protein